MGLSIITETDTPTANQRIDFVIPNNSKLQKTPFQYAKKLVIGEFKSERDKFSKGDLLMLYSKALSYISGIHGYGGKSNKEKAPLLNEVSCVLILGTKRSVKVLNSLQIKFKKLEQGVYEANIPLHLVIIELSSVKDMGKLNSLLLFGGKKQRKIVMEKAIRENDRFIIPMSYMLFNKEWLKLAKSINPESISIKEAVNILGINRVITELGLDRVIQEVGLDKVIQEIGLDKVIQEVGLDSFLEILASNNLIEDLDPDKLSPKAKEALKKLYKKLSQ